MRTTVRLQEIVREAAAFATHGAKVRCEFDLAADLRAADADKGQIGQVVQNLVINASQAMPGGGVVRIVLRNDRIGEGADAARVPGDYLEAFDQRHRGGQSRPSCYRIFSNPTSPRRRRAPDSGLATVYSIVRKHRGHVTVEIAARARHRQSSISGCRPRWRHAPDSWGRAARRSRRSEAASSSWTTRTPCA